ncbi:MAG: TrkA C-terminal domain-containing protein [Nitrospirota bacterium]
MRTAISARRLARIIGTGSWRIHPVPITQESPWRGGTLTGDMPTGICLAVRRDQSLQPFTPDWRFLDGDVLLVLAPPTCYSDWDQWIANGARDARDARPN